MQENCSWVLLGSIDENSPFSCIVTYNVINLGISEQYLKGINR